MSRSKPRAKAVGGSRKSAGEVDGSETGSTNEAASFQKKNCANEMDGTISETSSLGLFDVWIRMIRNQKFVVLFDMRT